MIRLEKAFLERPEHAVVFTKNSTFGTKRHATRFMPKLSFKIDWQDPIDERLIFQYVRPSNC